MQKRENKMFGLDPFAVSLTDGWLLSWAMHHAGNGVKDESAPDRIRTRDAAMLLSAWKSFNNKQFNVPLAFSILEVTTKRTKVLNIHRNNVKSNVLSTTQSKNRPFLVQSPPPHPTYTHICMYVDAWESFNTRQFNVPFAFCYLFWNSQPK